MKPDLILEYITNEYYFYFQYSSTLLVEVHNDYGNISCYVHQGRKEVLQAIENIKEYLSNHGISVYLPLDFKSLDEVFY